MSIDIDVQGKLFPNLATMIIQLLSTGVMVYFLWRFLWKPAHKYLADKAALVQKPLDEAIEREKAAQAANAEADQRLSAAAAKAQEIIKQGQVEGNKAREELSEKGRAEAEQAKEAAQRQIASDRAKMYEGVKKEIVGVALAATEKLMKDSADPEKNKAAIEDFVRDGKDGR